MAEKRRYYKELRIAQLRAVVQLSKSQGFAAAANALNLSTPSVWQQIRGLEKEFDTSLVIVDGQHVRLTEQGQLLVKLATPVVQGFDEIRLEFANQNAARKLRLSVAAPNDVLVNILAQTILSFREAHPEVGLSLIDSPSNPSKKMVEEGEVDLAIAGNLDRELPPNIVADHVGRFSFTLVCPAGHPLMSLQRVTPKALAKYPQVVASQGTNTRLRVDSVFDRYGLLGNRTIAIEASTKELTLMYVNMDFGIAIVPMARRKLAEMAAASEPSIVTRDLSTLFGHEHLLMMRRKNQYEPHHQLAFRETILSQVDPDELAD